MSTDPKHTLKILEKLKVLGFDDKAFALLHHFPATGKRNATIAGFEQWCRETGEFQPEGSNSRVHQRLELVLNAYSGGGFKSESSEIFRALAEAAALEIPFE